MTARNIRVESDKEDLLQFHASWKCYKEEGSNKQVKMLRMFTGYCKFISRSSRIIIIIINNSDKFNYYTG